MYILYLKVPVSIFITRAGPVKFQEFRFQGLLLSLRGRPMQEHILETQTSLKNSESKVSTFHFSVTDKNLLNMQLDILRTYRLYTGN